MRVTTILLTIILIGLVFSSQAYEYMGNNIYNSDTNIWWVIY